MKRTEGGEAGAERVRRSPGTAALVLPQGRVVREGVDAPGMGDKEGRL